MSKEPGAEGGPPCCAQHGDVSPSWSPCPASAGGGSTANVRHIGVPAGYGNIFHHRWQTLRDTARGSAGSARCPLLCRTSILVAVFPTVRGLGVQVSVRHHYNGTQREPPPVSVDTSGVSSLNRDVAVMCAPFGAGRTMARMGTGPANLTGARADRTSRTARLPHRAGRARTSGGRVVQRAENGLRCAAGCPGRHR